MKYLICIGLILLLIPSVLAGITGSETLERTVSTTQVNVGSTFQVCYTVVGATGQWAIPYVDVISGGCTLNSGATQVTDVMLSDSPDTPGPRCATVRTPSSAATCTFHGDYDLAGVQNNKLITPDVTVSVGNAPACTNGAQRDCTIVGCAGKETCSSGTWGTCVKNNPSCGTCTPETDTTFCSRLGKTCGQVTAADNCGTSRTVASCGSCSGTQTCSSGTCTTPPPNCNYGDWTPSDCPASCKQTKSAPGCADLIQDCTGGTCATIVKNDAYCAAQTACTNSGKCTANDKQTTCVSDCAFYQKWSKTDQECVTNTGMIVLIVIGFVAFQFIRH